MGIAHQIRRREPISNDSTMKKLKELAGAGVIDPSTTINRCAARIAAEMAKIHGGDYRVQIDHQCHFVLVIRNSP